VVVWSTQNKPYRIRSVYHGPGRGWTHVVDVTQAAGSHHPQVGIAADGTVRLLYVHHPVGQPRSLLFRSRHPGEGWSNATTVAREGYAPSLAVDRAGDALVVFMPTWIGPVEAVYRPTGGRWGTAHRLSPDSAYSLAMNGRGTALVALAHEGGRVDLVRRPPHGPWSAPAWLSPADGSASDFVSVALNETGDTWVAWGQEVLHGRYRPSGGSWSSILTVAPDPGGEIEGVSSQVAPNGDAVVLYDNENAPRTMRAMTATP
jgi:hypothetical protein